jgi:hypothetical protein
MELPDDVLGLVHDFSRPLTRPGWRKLKPMYSFKFHRDIMNTFNVRDIPVINSFVERYRRHEMQYIYCMDFYDDNFIAAIRVNLRY